MFWHFVVRTYNRKHPIQVLACGWHNLIRIKELHTKSQTIAHVPTYLLSLRSPSKIIKGNIINSDH